MKDYLNIALVLVFIITLVSVSFIKRNSQVEKCEKLNGMVVKTWDDQHLCIKKDAVIKLE